MNPNRSIPRYTFAAGLAAALAMAALTPSARANVYATNIKINGTLQGTASVSEGGGATISYILNEPASLGVAVQILSGDTPVRTIVIASGSPGSTRGLNTVAWDGKDDSNVVLPAGNYTVQVMASSSGYSDWTQINQPTDPGYSVYWPSGIAVDTRIDSPYYGRIMVANGADTAANNPGIVKLNADGSYADEGPNGPSTAGYVFTPDGYKSDSVRSLKYGSDDRIYFNDWTGPGKIVACDMIMSTNQIILDTAEWPGNPGNWADIDVTDPGTTNGMAWLGDARYPPAGVWAFPLTNNGVADPNSGGFNVVANGPDIPIRAGFGMVIDTRSDIFIGSVRANATDASQKLTCITNVFQGPDGSPTNWWNTVNAYPFIDQNLAWYDGAELNSTFVYSFDVAINSRSNPTLLTQVYNGGSGGMKIINPADGTVITNINQGVSIYYIGTCFDAVGNVYVGNGNSTWQVFSPPGPNQATTPAVVTITVGAAPTPTDVKGITVSAGTVTIKFTGDSSLPASAFKVYSSSTVNGIYTDAGAAVTGSDGSYTATVPVNGNAQFYRIEQ